MVDRYTSMWSNFAKTSKPIPTNNKAFENVTWKPLIPSEDNYLEINLNMTMKNHMYPDRYKLWENLFPLKPLNLTV